RTPAVSAVPARRSGCPPSWSGAPDAVPRPAADGPAPARGVTTNRGWLVAASLAVKSLSGLVETGLCNSKSADAWPAGRAGRTESVTSRVNHWPMRVAVSEPSNDPVAGWVFQVTLNSDQFAAVAYRLVCTSVVEVLPPLIRP